MQCNQVIVSPDSYKLPRESINTILYRKINEHDFKKILLVDLADNFEMHCGLFRQLTKSLAIALLKLGVQKGDIITIISPNNWKHPIITCAGLYTGATMNLLDNESTLGELKHLFSICQPKIIFCTMSVLENILILKRQELWCGKIVLMDGENPLDETSSLNDLLVHPADDTDFTPIELNEKEDIAFVLASSGTTGLPKQVVLTYENMKVTLLNMGHQNIFDFNTNETILAFLPFYHLLGVMVFMGSILFSSKMIILKKFNPHAFLKAIENNKVTKLVCSPPTVLFLAKSRLVDTYDLSSLKDIACGAAMLGDDLETMTKERLKLQIRQLYGLSETGTVFALPRNICKRGSVGKVVCHMVAKVSDIATGVTLGPNQLGEIRVKGDGVTPGYYNNIEQTKAAFDHDGFFLTGDLGYYDTDECFYIVDRLKEIIKYNAHQVSPAELEDVLVKHPAVKDAGVIGIPDERTGELPTAFIVKQPGHNLTEHEIIQYVKGQVASYKQLRGGVTFLDEIPKSKSGKILRRKLREMALKPQCKL